MWREHPWLPSKPGTIFPSNSETRISKRGEIKTKQKKKKKIKIKRYDNFQQVT